MVPIGYLYTLQKTCSISSVDQGHGQQRWYSNRNETKLVIAEATIGRNWLLWQGNCAAPWPKPIFFSLFYTPAARYSATFPYPQNLQGNVKS